MEVISIGSSQPVTRIITPYAFKERFTEDEVVAIYTLAKSVVHIQIYLDDLNRLKQVDLALLKTKMSLQALQAAGVLTEERVNEIINNPVQPYET